MGAEFEDLAFCMFVMYVCVGARRGEFDVIYVSGNSMVRLAESEGIVGRWGIWYKANEGQT